MALKVTIKKQTYPVLFGYGSFRYLGKLWNCEGTGAVMQKIATLESIAETGLTFAQEDIVADVVLAGIQCADKNVELPEKEDVQQSILFDAETLQKIFAELVNAFPKMGNPQPAKAGRQKPKKK